MVFNIDDKMCFELIKSLSYLLAHCLDMDISEINVDDCIKNYCRNLNIKKKEKNLKIKKLMKQNQRN